MSVKQYAFVIDLKRCIGCDTCIVGCKVENEVGEGHFRLKVLDSNRDPISEKPRGTFPDFSQYWLPTMCQHCANAPCIEVCPTAALWRREDDGVVMLDPDKCVGCLRCGEACPYDALSFDTKSGCADKCSMCAHRIEHQEAPSCVVVCPTRAIHFGDINDADSKVAQLVATRDTRVLGESGGAQPQIFYLEPW